MSRDIKLVFKGAAYYLTGGCESQLDLCETEEDYAVFLQTLEEVEASFGWHIYAFCLTKKEYHLMVDTPEGNLSEGMSYFLSKYSQRYQSRRGKTGRLFAGRYQAKSLETTDEIFAAVCNYIHWIPARENLLNLRTEKLGDYLQSSYRFYLRPSIRPAWLSVHPILRAQGLNDDKSGLTKYRNGFKKQIDQSVSGGSSLRLNSVEAKLREDWAVGSDSFKNELLDLLEERLKHIRRDSLFGEMKKAYEVREAERCLAAALQVVGCTLPELKKLKKMDQRKRVLCWHLKQCTHVSSAWIAQTLYMGVPGNISRGIRETEVATEGALFELRSLLEKG